MAQQSVRTPAADPQPATSEAVARVPVQGTRRWWRRPVKDVEPVPHAAPDPVDIAPDDPLLAWLAAARRPVDLDDVLVDSAGVQEMRRRGVQLLVPLLSSGELVGVLALGAPQHEERYSRDARTVLESLAARAAPAIQVGQLVQRQADAARERERVDHELEVARLVQQQFLPTDLPRLDGWQLAAFYRPARTVGGDFYEFLPLPDGRLMVVVGDVTDKGVPAALVMSGTHALLRAEVARHACPARLLESVNRLLCEDIPAHMFVTCLAMLLDPRTGEVQLANAGHNLPLIRRSSGVEELTATGLPLGLMPGARYDLRETVLEAGDALLLYSDGLTEAHDPSRRMFGVPRLTRLVEETVPGPDLVDRCLAELERFTGPDAEQEDDITLVTLGRRGGPGRGGPGRTRPPTAGVPATSADGPGDGAPASAGTGGDDVLLERFSVPSVRGTERAVAEQVLAAVTECGLDGPARERLATAVAETAMNAIEHGNGEAADAEVEVAVWRTAAGTRVDVSDQARTGRSVDPHAPDPDIDLKLAGLQSPRGWGLFLIRSMVDAVEEHTEPGRHTVRLHQHLHRNGEA